MHDPATLRTARTSVSVVDGCELSASAPYFPASRQPCSDAQTEATSSSSSCRSAIWLCCRGKAVKGKGASCQPQMPHQQCRNRVGVATLILLGIRQSGWTQTRLHVSLSRSAAPASQHHRCKLQRYRRVGGENAIHCQCNRYPKLHRARTRGALAGIILLRSSF